MLLAVLTTGDCGKGGGLVLIKSISSYACLALLAVGWYGGKGGILKDLKGRNLETEEETGGGGGNNDASLAENKGISTVA